MNDLELRKMNRIRPIPWSDIVPCPKCRVGICTVSEYYGAWKSTCQGEAMTNEYFKVVAECGCDLSEGQYNKAWQLASQKDPNMNIFNEEGFTAPALLWLPISEVEPGALDQIRDVSRLPILASSLRVMPDCHKGMGVTIGSVLETQSAVIPNAVGVDIGCGVMAINTGVILTPEMDKTFWRSWAGKVSRDVPVGFHWHTEQQEWHGFNDTLACGELEIMKTGRHKQQIGTLGGGNHFLEALVDDATNEIWVMVHSGSRRIGMDIANYYHELAVAQTKTHTDVPDNREKQGLCYLHFDLDEQARNYLHDMKWAKDYAHESRVRMGVHMLNALGWQESESVVHVVHCCHNYAELSKANGTVLHRKGATNAALNYLGVIPGSMGTPSYIVKGLGNPDSLNSCSHGAGRAMSRNRARKEISEAALAASMAGTYTSPSTKFTDEGPAAYKDIETVMSRQTDLVDVVTTLRPLITIKGGGKDEG